MATNAPPAPELDPGGAAFDAAFDQSFSLIAFTLNRHLIDHMLRAMRELEVDFESLVLWGLLSHLNVAHLVPPGSGPTLVLTERGRLKAGSTELRPMRLRDLEQVSRLPRETVRRKLNKLMQQGYVTQVEGGWVLDISRVDPSLREFNRETARRTLRMADELARLLAQGALRAQAAAAVSGGAGGDRPGPPAAD
jgi:hypothetical protein